MSLITYIDYLQKKNADDLAFYPLTTLEKALEENRVLTCEDNHRVMFQEVMDGSLVGWK